jgi:hypothetical protein
VLNSVRPGALYFSQLHAHDIDLCSIRGFAESVDAVYEYTAALNGNSEIESAEVEDIQNRQGKVSFVLEVKFTPTPSRWFGTPTSSEKEVFKTHVNKETTVKESEAKIADMAVVEETSFPVPEESNPAISVLSQDQSAQAVLIKKPTEEFPLPK